MFDLIFFSNCKTWTALKNNCSTCQIECKKFGRDYIQSDCVQKSNETSTKNCYCCQNKTKKNCVLLNRTCSECVNTCRGINLIFDYCIEAINDELPRFSSCYCCPKLENKKTTTIIFKNTTEDTPIIIKSFRVVFEKTL